MKRTWRGVLGSEDKEYKILEKLLDNFGSFNDSLEAFKRGVESGDTLLDLIVENDNEEAWDWGDRLHC